MTGTPLAVWFGGVFWLGIVALIVSAILNPRPRLRALIIFDFGLLLSIGPVSALSGLTPTYNESFLGVVVTILTAPSILMHGAQVRFGLNPFYVTVCIVAIVFAIIYGGRVFTKRRPR